MGVGAQRGARGAVLDEVPALDQPIDQHRMLHIDGRVDHRDHAAGADAALLRLRQADEPGGRLVGVAGPQLAGRSVRLGAEQRCPLPGRGLEDRVCRLADGRFWKRFGQEGVGCRLGSLDRPVERDQRRGGVVRRAGHVDQHQRDLVAVRIPLQPIDDGQLVARGDVLELTGRGADDHELRGLLGRLRRHATDPRSQRHQPGGDDAADRES